MSLTGALSNALSGLTAASRSAGVVSSNIANVMTDGYATRSLSLSSRSHGAGGVRIDGIERSTSPQLTAERRQAEAEQAQSNSLAMGLARLEALYGTPLEGNSLSARLVAFEIALAEASSRPDSRERLNRVVTDASALAEKFQTISDGIQSLRTEADQTIASLVRQMNADLGRVQQLNAQITSLRVQDVEASALLDERQVLIDRISRVVPVLEIPRDRGAVALFTPEGAILLDGRPAHFGFEPVNLVAAQMSQDAGLLSGLTLNGRVVLTDKDHSPFRGGTLDASFQLRDDYGYDAQKQLDALARDLIERFGSQSLDPSLSPGQPGLFTDAALPFNPDREAGLSARISINPALDPDKGGLLWRLRDGLSAVSEGPIGNASMLFRMIDALNQRRELSSGSHVQASLTFADHLAKSLSSIGMSRQIAEQSQSFAATRTSSLKLAEAERGVDTDEQLQRLMLIEQSYAANARVIQTIDDMIQNLLRI